MLKTTLGDRCRAPVRRVDRLSALYDSPRHRVVRPQPASATGNVRRRGCISGAMRCAGLRCLSTDPRQARIHHQCGEVIGHPEHRLLVQIDHYGHELEMLEIRMLVDPQATPGDGAAPREAATTARSTMPLASSQVIPSRRATAAGVASFSHAIAWRSNSIVNRECATAHGTGTVLTPCFGHRTRGTVACSRASYWHVSRCRHSARHDRGSARRSDTPGT